MPQHRYVGDHADTVMVGDNSIPVAPGDFVDLEKDDLEDEGNASLIESGQLVDVKEAEKDSAEQQKAEKEAAAKAEKEVAAADDTKEVKK